MNVCVVGAAGAFGIKHLDAISCIEGAVVTSIVGTNTEKMKAFAANRTLQTWQIALLVMMLMRLFLPLLHKCMRLRLFSVWKRVNMSW